MNRGPVPQQQHHDDFADAERSGPPLGQCPAWCEKPPGHEWDDAWQAGPVRFHTWRRQITTHQAVTVEEIEQFTSQGPTRQRDILFDVPRLIPWDIPTARRAHRLLAQALAIAAGETDSDASLSSAGDLPGPTCSSTNRCEPAGNHG